MKSTVLYYTALLLYFYTFLFSCTHKQDQNLLPELILAESMMYQYPDSAQLILEEMDVPSPCDPLQHATWSLLLTQARYKNYVTQDSDSLINIAYDYFIKQEDPQRKALSLYLKGALYAEWGEADKALPYLLNAAEEMEKTTDFQLGHLIHLEIGSIYVYRVLYDYAKISFEKALEYAKLSENKVYIASSLLHIARVHSLIESYEASIPYYEEAIKAAKISQRPNTISSALNELAAIHRECGNYELALHYVYEALNISKKNNLTVEQHY
ncbi:MAG: tetratricopeptide repeat protein [Bacteroides sp.]|nr:tetratricopeptide repeat protein [Bacteroides sp.]